VSHKRNEKLLRGGKKKKKKRGRGYCSCNQKKWVFLGEIFNYIKKEEEGDRGKKAKEGKRGRKGIKLG